MLKAELIMSSLENEKIRIIDPALIPKISLNKGSEIPVIGLGTFGSDHITNEQIAEAVKYAIEIGYRHFDCASVYGNEADIGRILAEMINNGSVKRDELWITSKVWSDMHGEEQVIESCKKSLSDLQLDYLDLYLIHWPFPNYHAPGCSGDTRNPESKPYIHEDFMIAWRQMEKLVEMGLVKNIGTSNMTIPKMDLLLKDAKITPAINEMELHPHFQQPELFSYCISKNIFQSLFP